MKLLKFFQYVYLVFAVLLSFEAYANWSSNRQRAYLYIVLAILAVFMFFFRAKFRRKFEDRQNQ